MRSTAKASPPMHAAMITGRPSTAGSGALVTESRGGSASRDISSLDDYQGFPKL